MKQILLFCFLFIGSLYAQEYEVTGKVTDGLLEELVLILMVNTLSK